MTDADTVYGARARELLDQMWSGAAPAADVAPLAELMQEHDSLEARLGAAKELMQRMITSAECFTAADHTGEQVVTGYKIKTGAMHQLAPLLGCYLLSAQPTAKEQGLLKRAQKHLLAWAKWYGEHDGRHCKCGAGLSLPLPPAGDVRLAEDIDDLRATEPRLRPAHVDMEEGFQ